MSVTLNGVLQILAAMERYFRGGYGWGRGMLHNYVNSRKCLVGAVTSVRASSGGTSWVPSEEIDAAKHFIELAVRERGGHAIETFNDSSSYREIAAVIGRAKELAMMEYMRQLPAPLPVLEGEILPPVRPAVPAPAPVPVAHQPVTMSARPSLATWVWE